jgi:N-terminal domain of DPF2/REQ.
MAILYTGRRHGQIYSYPAQRWKKKCSLPLPDIPIPRVKSADVESMETGLLIC